MAMMKGMSKAEMPMDMNLMQDCMMAMNACSMAATMCAGQDIAMEGMGRCAGMCMNMADMADTCMRMMMRPAGFDMNGMMAMMQACMAMGAACKAECEMHAEMAECCRYCAMACDDMMSKCEALLATMVPAD